MIETLQRLIVRAAIVAVCSSALHSQTPAATPKPEPDVLIFTNGEKLIGQLDSVKGGKVTFKSDMAGAVTVEWSKIQELHTTRPFAVIPKNVELSKHADTSQVAQGKLSMADQKIAVEPAAGTPRTMPVADANIVVAQPQFDKAVNHSEGFTEDWNGAITAGLSLVEATQNSETFTGGVALVRTAPMETWMNPSNKTLLNFSAAYGKISQPGTPDIKTAIYHAGGEQDEYFSPRLFGFGQGALDHNFSQGLDLQATLGGGLGYTAYKSAAAELDLKVAMSYIHQSFDVSASNESLVGTTFSEIYTSKLAHGILLNQQFSATPAWNNTSAYFANGSIVLTFPVHKRLSLSTAAVDSFLNDPPPGFKKNSFQLTAGLSYALK